MASLDRRGRGARTVQWRFDHRGLCRARDFTRQRGASAGTAERPPAIARPRPELARALTTPQQDAVLDLLHAPRFADQSPAEISATRVDEGDHRASNRFAARLGSTTGG
jgi:hypothetical protein